jgi:tripeptide aminopeptidase
MSDWGAVSDRVAGVHAGLDLEMPSSGGVNDAEVVRAVREGRLDEETTANWALITAGRVTNVVCDHVEIGGEVRSRDPKKVEAYIEYVQRHCEEVISKTPATCQVRVERIYDGFCIPHEDELLTTLCGVLEQRGIAPLIEMGGGGMDANRFNAAGIKSVGVASGYFKNHSTAEELYMEDLKRAGEMVYDLVMAYSAK